MQAKTIIGITDCGSFENYHNWVQREGNIEVIRLSPEGNNLDDVARCHGVILSGGEDIHPRLYNRDEYEKYCNKIDERRDHFEWQVLERLGNIGLPLLGICRGLQIANVYFGGTLVPDIPSFGKFNHSKFSDRDRRHNITVDPDSLLAGLAGTTSDSVNSAHHQSAELIGKGLIASAFSPEGVVEAIERLQPAAHPFLMLVQWHPERMPDQENPFSLHVKSAFLSAAREKAR